MTGTKFEIVSYVAHVRQTYDVLFPCEIALYEGNLINNVQPNSYHRSKTMNICEFAHRCKMNGIAVKIIGEIYLVTEINSIQFANTYVSSDGVSNESETAIDDVKSTPNPFHTHLLNILKKLN